MKDAAQIKRDRWAIGGGVAFMLVIAIPIWSEFSVRGEAVWNAFLAILLTGLVVGAVAAQRYFKAHAGEIGEARFDTRNKSDLNV